MEGISRRIIWELAATVVFVLLGQVPAGAQVRYSLSLQGVDCTSAFLADYRPDADWRADSLGVLAQVGEVLETLRADAFIEASADTLIWADSSCVARVVVGPAYTWAALDAGNVPEAILSRVGFRAARFSGRPFSYRELAALQEEMLTFLENHGYPFAEVGVDSLQLSPDGVLASLRLRRNRLIRLDTLRLTGDARVSRVYLQQYLGLLPGEPFDRERVLRSRDRLRELSFLRPAGDPQLRFEGERAILTLPLEKRPSSRFDFLIGVLPRSPTTGGMLITGDFEGELVNAFGRGERLYAQFEQLRPQTQELNLAFSYPYLLGLPVGVDFAFDLFRSDTSFLNLHLDLGVNYLFAGGNYLKAFWNLYRSSLLDVDPDALLEQPALPENLDMRTTSLGLEAWFQQLDYRFNPRRGWRLRLRGGAGVKRILRNAQIEELGLGYLYDSLEERSLQLRLEADAAWFLPILRRSTIMMGLRGGTVLSPQAVYRNEQFRLGGNRLLRGFDEESIFATHFAVGTLEYRLLIDQNAYLFTFVDGAWLQDRVPGREESVFPLGFGAGISFETRAGVFGVSLAFGKMKEQAVDFGRPKIHFGYVSLF